MAAVTNSVRSYDRIGEREDLADLIFDISPMDTELVSTAKRSPVNAVLTEWQTDALATPDGDNAYVEADDVTTFQTNAATVRVGNYTQISRKDLIVGDTVEYVRRAGRGEEKAYLLAKKGKELKRDMETIVFANQAGNGGGPTTARRLASLGAWLKTNTNIGTGGGDPAYTSGVPLAARTDAVATNLRAFTEPLLKDAIQQGWAAGAEIDSCVLYVGPVNKQKASAFTGIATKTSDIGSAARPFATVAAADIYVSDFGTVRIKPHRYQREQDAYLIDKSYLSLGFLRPIKRVPLAKTGDADKAMLITEWTLKVHNEAAHAAVFDLTTTLS